MVFESYFLYNSIISIWWQMLLEVNDLAGKNSVEQGRNMVSKCFSILRFFLNVALIYSRKYSIYTYS